MAVEVGYLEIKNKTGTEIVYQDSTFGFGIDTLGSIFTDITELSGMTAVSDEINGTAYDNSKSLIEVYNEYLDTHGGGQHIVWYDVTPEPTPSPTGNKVIKKIMYANQEYTVLGSGGSEGETHEVITQAAYDQLTPAQKAEKVYMIKESGTPSTVLTAGAGIDITNDTISADMSTAVYDNTTSGATATNVQDAIDEVNENINNLKNSTVINTSDTTPPTLSGLTYTLNADGVYVVDISNGHSRGVYIYLYLNGEMIGSVDGHIGGTDNKRLKATIFDGKAGDTIRLNSDPTGDTSGGRSVTKINRIYSVVSDF